MLSFRGSFGLTLLLIVLPRTLGRADDDSETLGGAGLPGLAHAGDDLPVSVGSPLAVEGGDEDANRALETAIDAMNVRIQHYCRHQGAIKDYRLLSAEKEVVSDAIEYVIDAEVDGGQMVTVRVALRGAGGKATFLGSSPYACSVRNSAMANCPADVEKHNADPSRSYDQAVYKMFQGHTYSSLARKYLGGLRVHSEAVLGVVVPDEDAALSFAVLEKGGGVPKSFDFREAEPNCVLPPQDQGSCGSCWGQSNAGMFEDRVCKASKGQLRVRLSVQQHVSCDKLCLPKPHSNLCQEGCNGGFQDLSGLYLEQSGLVEASVLPYRSGGSGSYEDHFDSKASEGECPSNILAKHVHYKAEPKSTRQVRGSASNIMTELSTNGPLDVAMMVYNDFWNYNNGVYKSNPNSGEAGGHAIKMLGYGTDKGTDYWLCQNSWGKGWGEKGYFRAARGDRIGLESSAWAVTPSLPSVAVLEDELPPATDEAAVDTADAAEPDPCVGLEGTSRKAKKAMKKCRRQQRTRSKAAAPSEGGTQLKEWIAYHFKEMFGMNGGTGGGGLAAARPTSVATASAPASVKREADDGGIDGDGGDGGDADEADGAASTADDSMPPPMEHRLTLVVGEKRFHHHHHHRHHGSRGHGHGGSDDDGEEEAEEATGWEQVGGDELYGAERPGDDTDPAWDVPPPVRADQSGVLQLISEATGRVEVSEPVYESDGKVIVDKRYLPAGIYRIALCDKDGNNCQVEDDKVHVAACPIVDGVECGGHGLCEEGRHGHGRCVCNEGYGGAACRPSCDHHPMLQSGCHARGGVWDTPEESHLGHAGADAFFRVQVDSECTLNITTCTPRTNFDTRIALYGGCPMQLPRSRQPVPLASNDDGCSLRGHEKASTLVAKVPPGAYLVHVEGADTHDLGDFEIHASGCGEPVGSHMGRWSGASVCPVEAPRLATPHPCAGEAVGLRPGDKVSKTLAAGQDALFVITPQEDVTLELSTCESLLDTQLFLYHGCPRPGGGGHLMATGDDECGNAAFVVDHLRAGVDYYVVVRGFEGEVRLACCKPLRAPAPRELGGAPHHSVRALGAPNCYPTGWHVHHWRHGGEQCLCQRQRGGGADPWQEHRAAPRRRRQA